MSSFLLLSSLCFVTNSLVPDHGAAGPVPPPEAAAGPAVPPGLLGPWGSPAPGHGRTPGAPPGAPAHGRAWGARGAGGSTGGARTAWIRTGRRLWPLS